MKMTFGDLYSNLFSKHSKTVNLPRNDVLFDDFMDLKMDNCKETHIHSMTFYHTPMKIIGFEIEYFMDGGSLKSLNHHISPMVLFKTPAGKEENDVVSKFQKGIEKIESPNA